MLRCSVLFTQKPTKYIHMQQQTWGNSMLTMGLPLTISLAKPPLFDSKPEPGGSWSAGPHSCNPVYGARHSKLLCKSTSLMQLHCLPPTLLQLVCSPLGCEHEQRWSLQWDHFCLLAHHHMQAGSEFAQRLLESNSTIRSIPVYVTLMPQRRASKLEFGNLRQTEFPISSWSCKY